RWLGAPSHRQESPGEPAHEAIRARLATGASFWADLLADIGETDPAELQEALWDLVWAGEVTNDAFAPLRAPRLTLAREDRDAGRRFARRRRAGAPQVQGRWSLTGPLFADSPAHGSRMRAVSELLLERHGIVTRETVLAEGIPGGFAALYGELANLETLGTARRGYFVEGLGGAQFAVPAAIERLRGLRADEPAGPLVLAVTDPANPFGASLPWPRRDDADAARRPSRVPGAYVVTLDAEPVLYVERGGKGLVSLRAPRTAAGEPADWLEEALETLAEHVRRGRIKRLSLERFDGEPVVGSAYEPLLVEVGFRQGPRRLTLSA
ncbi:MAG: DEAD/DEAH box helicase, partial [Actinomycetota bacterium]|nr:DEAD/DEAH box helicase [Actinomycetota bacterium]